VRLSLHLHEECALAIIDYLKNERPESSDGHIFLECVAPYRPLAKARTHHDVFSDGFARAGVDTTGKHHGAHAARHSLAVSMLSAKTPLPVITGILGHKSSNTTMRYLKVEAESPRPLSLEVPDGCR
jgi:site-specific recombinase XerD